MTSHAPQKAMPAIIQTRIARCRAGFAAAKSGAMPRGKIKLAASRLWPPLSPPLENRDNSRVSRRFFSSDRERSPDERLDAAVDDGDRLVLDLRHLGRRVELQQEAGAADAPPPRTRHRSQSRE
jgi:hypothetical protein